MTACHSCDWVTLCGDSEGILQMSLRFKISWFWIHRSGIIFCGPGLIRWKHWGEGLGSPCGWSCSLQAGWGESSRGEDYVGGDRRWPWLASASNLIELGVGSSPVRPSGDTAVPPNVSMAAWWDPGQTMQPSSAQAPDSWKLVLWYYVTEPIQNL